MIIYRYIVRKCSMKNKCLHYSTATTSTVPSRESYANFDKLESVAIKLPLKTNAINVRYSDSATFFKNTGDRTLVMPTVITSHGTPGSHNDFKYMVPKLVSSGYRVISLNWPGFGFTDSPLSPDEFDQTNFQRAQLMTCFVKSLNLEKVDLMIGHSAGCYPLPLFFMENPGFCSAAIFVNPAGATPHKHIRPYWVVQLLARLLDTFDISVINYFLNFVSKRFFKLRINQLNQAGVMTRVIGKVDFVHLNAALLSLKQSKTPPVFLMSGRQDQLVEVEKSIEYAEKLGCNEHQGIFQVENGAELDKFKRNIFHSLDGRLCRRHYAVIFAYGTHFLQKLEAEAICKLSCEIIDSNKRALD